MARYPVEVIKTVVISITQVILMGHKHAGNISLHHYICSYLDGVILRRCFYQI